jgi:hypothetical protein
MYFALPNTHVNCASTNLCLLFCTTCIELVLNVLWVRMFCIMC